MKKIVILLIIFMLFNCGCGREKTTDIPDTTTKAITTAGSSTTAFTPVSTLKQHTETTTAEALNPVTASYEEAEGILAAYTEESLLPENYPEVFDARTGDRSAFFSFFEAIYNTYTSIVIVDNYGATEDITLTYISRTQDGIIAVWDYTRVKSLPESQRVYNCAEAPSIARFYLPGRVIYALTDSRKDTYADFSSRYTESEILNRTVFLFDTDTIPAVTANFDEARAFCAAYAGEWELPPEFPDICDTRLASERDDTVFRAFLAKAEAGHEASVIILSNSYSRVNTFVTYLSYADGVYTYASGTVYPEYSYFYNRNNFGCESYKRLVPFDKEWGYGYLLTDADNLEYDEIVALTAKSWEKSPYYFLFTCIPQYVPALSSPHSEIFVMCRVVNSYLIENPDHDFTISVLKLNDGFCTECINISKYYSVSKALADSEYLDVVSLDRYLLVSRDLESRFGLYHYEEIASYLSDIALIDVPRRGLSTEEKVVIAFCNYFPGYRYDSTERKLQILTLTFGNGVCGYAVSSDVYCSLSAAGDAAQTAQTAPNFLSIARLTVNFTASEYLGLNYDEVMMLLSAAGMTAVDIS